MPWSRSERGSTLVELSAAMGIVAVLGTAAIASMHGAPDRADDVRARSALHIAHVATLTVDEPSPSELAAAEAALTWTTKPSLDPDTISVDASAGRIGLAVQSSSGTCWLLRTQSDGSVSYGSSTGPCSGTDALTAGTGSWDSIDGMTTVG